MQGYKVYTPSEETVAKLRRLINPRRGPNSSVPGVDMETSCRLGDEMFSKFGLDEYVGCVTAEMESRPVPQVFEEKETEALTRLYEKWAPLIMERMLPYIEPTIQTYNKVSRLGWPYFSHPDNKLDVLIPEFDVFAKGDFSKYENAFILQNVRLQAEPKQKEREYLFLEGDSVKQVKVNAAARTVKVGKDKRVGSRTRLVFNMPLPNLYKQILDTAIHSWLLKHRAFHHDMFSPGGTLPVTGYHMCFDVKHFERHTASLVRARGKLIGGQYGDIVSLFSRLPFGCPTSDWMAAAFLYVLRELGFSDQFASGDSAVAPVQKEVFWALIAEFLCVMFGMDPNAALTMVLEGATPYLNIRNYGDDNSVDGDKECCEDLFAFLKQYLHVELEEPKKFLGFTWDDKNRRWYLGVSSYLTKTYLNERRPFSNFRKYPFLGWVLKRETYRKIGDPRLTSEVFPYEDALLAEAGLPWSEVVERAQLERLAAMATPGHSDTKWIMGKDYLMSDEEKLKTGEFSGLMPNQTAPILKKLLGSTWAKRLRW